MPKPSSEERARAQILQRILVDLVALVDWEDMKENLLSMGEDPDEIVAAVAWLAEEAGEEPVFEIGALSEEEVDDPTEF